MNEYIVHVSLTDPRTGESSTVTKQVKLMTEDNVLNVIIKTEANLRDGGRRSSDLDISLDRILYAG